MIEERGNKICVVHGHKQKPGSKTDKPKGSVIKCWDNNEYGREKARKMHYAIMANQGMTND